MPLRVTRKEFLEHAAEKGYPLERLSLFGKVALFFGPNGTLFRDNPDYAWVDVICLCGISQPTDTFYADPYQDGDE